MDDEYGLLHITPIDGRYMKSTKPLQNYFSEYALIYYRTYVEITYLKALSQPLNILDYNGTVEISSIIDNFSIKDAKRIKEIEKETNHDIKAIEYFIGEKCTEKNLSHIKPFIHFGLTSQDINNTAIPLLLKNYITKEFIPELDIILEKLEELTFRWQFIVILSHTHGQPASPTTFGKEMKVFLYRLKKQKEILESVKYWAKFGGAVGNLNAHLVSYPNINWIEFSNNYIDSIGLERNMYTTQIDNYENLSVLFDCIVRMNVIFVDFCRDIWSYISMEYLKCKVIKNEVGSSTMPHKVNPIQFENAEGNLLLANSIFTFLSQKLPISRLQRDLTDSTVLRNVGVSFGYTKVAFTNIIKGIDKLDINLEKINEKLEKNWVIVSEAIQTILRKHNIPNAYEILKKLTRENNQISKYDIYKFIEELDVPLYVKQELMIISPYTYTGYGGNYNAYENLKTPKSVRITTI